MKNLLLYLLALLASLYLMVMYEDNYLYRLFLAGVLLLFLLFGLSLYLGRRLGIRLTSPRNSYQPREKLPFVMELTNPTRLPIRQLRLKVAYTNSLTGETQTRWYRTAVAARAGARLTGYLNVPDCGLLTIEVRTLKAYDYLNLFGLPRHPHQDLTCALLPEKYPVLLEFSELPAAPAGDGDHFSATKKGDDPSEVFDLREYQPGDSPRRIHWKLSARTRSLMVKDLARPEGCPLTLFLNLSFPPAAAIPPRRSCVLLSALTSLSFQLTAAGLIHNLLWCGADGQLARQRVETEEDTYLALAGLLRVVPYPAARDWPDFYRDTYRDTGLLYFISIGPDLTLRVNNDQTFPFIPTADDSYQLKLEL